MSCVLQDNCWETCRNVSQKKKKKTSEEVYQEQFFNKTDAFFGTSAATSYK